MLWTHKYSILENLNIKKPVIQIPENLRFQVNQWFDNTLDINTKNSVEKCLNRYRNFQNLISRGSIRASFDKNVEELKSRFNQVRWFDQETRLWWSDGEGEGREKEWISSKFSTLLSVKSSYPQDPSPQETVHAKLLAQSGF